ncbi:hypothetical protein FKM82_021722 [Ascaphus truei]
MGLRDTFVLDRDPSSCVDAAASVSVGVISSCVTGVSLREGAGAETALPWICWWKDFAMSPWGCVWEPHLPDRSIKSCLLYLHTTLPAAGDTPSTHPETGRGLGLSHPKLPHIHPF